jgi:hypothetical protein
LLGHPFASGDGTKDNPYLIVTAEQLDSIRLDLEGKEVCKVYSGYAESGIFNKLLPIQNVTEDSYILQLSICGAMRYAKFELKIKSNEKIV